jgi:hypothetical protein
MYDSNERRTPVNLGTKDRLARVMVAVLLLVQLLVSSEASFWQLIISLFSAPLLVTAAMAWDPFYTLFKKSTAARSTPVAKEAPSGILISAAYAERIRKARYPSRYTVSDSTA